MGRRRHGRDSSLHDSSPEMDINGIMPEESSFFSKISSFDMEASRVQWGLLSISTMRELDLSEEELSAMLLSQLDLRDKFIETLSSKMNDVISQGHVLEKDYNNLNYKIWNTQSADCDRRRSKQDVDQEIKDEKKLSADADKSHNTKSDSSNQHHDKDRESLNQYHDKVSESSVSDNKSNSPSVLSVPELPTHSKIKSEKQGDDDKKDDGGEKDKFKAMVAMAFKAQGYGFLSGIKDKDNSSEVKLGKSKDDSEKNTNIGHGWKVEESITQQVQDAAAENLSHSGYAYQEELGLYYDYTSGYYYNAENGLYYDPKTGTYFFFDHDTNSYQFHSQVPVESDSDANTKADAQESAQESETPTKAQELSLEVPVSEKVDETAQDSDGEGHRVYDSQSKIPPSLRLMVTESGCEKVKVGELHLVTINGGTVGRKPENLIQLLDVSVSKVHAEISYRSKYTDDHHYFVKDLGSNLGTFINGTCICVPGEPSDEIEIGHGWELQFGSVKMKCHIHPGYLSCNDCEPGLVLANLPSQSGEQSEPKVLHNSIEKARKKILKAMRKKYALQGEADIPLFSSDYADRAQKRRKEKGSDNPYEKTEVASTETELRDNNKGFELLKKMGWSKGQGLGKTQPGIIKPIEATSTVGREGLGFGGLGLPAPTGNITKRKKILDVTTARFKKL